MSSEKEQKIKTRLHPRNKNRERYDLDALIVATPELKAHLMPNKLGEQSVDFWLNGHFLGSNPLKRLL